LGSQDTQGEIKQSIKTLGARPWQMEKQGGRLLKKRQNLLKHRIGVGIRSLRGGSPIGRKGTVIERRLTTLFPVTGQNRLNAEKGYLKKGRKRRVSQ